MNDQLPFTRESQTEQIKAWLLAGHSLTALEALQHFNCLRVGARAWDLRKEGYNVKSEIIETPSGKHVARYYIPKDDQLIAPTNGRRKLSLRELAKAYIEMLPEEQKLQTQLVLSGFIVWTEI